MILKAVDDDVVEYEDIRYIFEGVFYLIGAL